MGSIEQTAEVIVRVNTKEATDRLATLEKKAATLRERFAQATKLGDTKEVERLNKEINKVTRSIEQQRDRVSQCRAAMKSLNEQSPRELQKTIRLINAELNSGRVARGSREWKEYVAALKKAKAELSAVNSELGESKSLLSKVKDKLNDWGMMAAGAIAAFAGVVMSGKQAVNAYAEMQQEEANVRKFTGMTAEEVEKLNEQFKRIDTRTGRDELNRLAQEAGRLGKTSQEDVLGFVSAADKINVALDDLGEGATLTLSKLTGVFGVETEYGTEQSLLKVGSVINDLSQNCSASAPYLAEFASRLGGVAAQAGITIPEIMAYAAVLDSSNMNLEASSTALSQLIMRLMQEPAKYARVAGMEVEKFQKLLKEDVNGALLMFFEHLQKAGSMNNLALMFKDMGENGARAIATFTALTGKIDELKRQQDVANESFREGVSVGNEFEVQNTTVQAQLDKARKKFSELTIELGKELLPVMRYCVSGASMLARAMLATVKFIKEHKSEILALTVAVTTYTVAVNANAIATGVMTAATKAAAVAQKALNLAMRANPIGLVAAALAGLVTWLISYQSAAAKAERAQKGLNAEQRAELDLQRRIEDASRTRAGSRTAEIANIKMLVAVAEDENASLTSRKNAIERLNKIIPYYNAGLDASGKAYTANKKALDEYISSLEKRIRLESYEDVLKDLEKQKQKMEKFLEKMLAGKKKPETHGAFYNWLFGNSIKTNEKIFEQHIANQRNKIKEIEIEQQKIYDKIKNEELITPDINTPEVVPDYKSEESAKEAEKAAKKAKEKARAELKDAIAMARGLRDASLAENTAEYAAGRKTYAKYLEDKNAITLDAIAKEKEIYETRRMTSEQGYGALLKQEQELLLKSVEEKRKISLEALERLHKEETQSATKAYFDTNSILFQNDRAYKQALLVAEVNYLARKQRLYAENSREWVDIEREIHDTMERDKLDKQKELARNYQKWRDEYEKASGSEREQREIAAMTELYNKKLISEKQYQQAVADIKDRYAKQDIDRIKRSGNEYSNMTIDLFTSFDKLFKSIEEGGGLTFENIAGACSAAFGVMNAALSSYSSYVNAERDLELAKVEERYDKEIAAAGKNTRKKERIEKKKEEDIAKLKKKYNDKAMKIEIAQAVASTAMAAINAYASASKVNWVLGPIAAAMATAAGMIQIAAIKKQHEAQAAGYYSGGFTTRDPDNRREVGVVHANEFVANHQAVANPELSPLLRIIDAAQKSNTVGSLTARDVSNALGQGAGVSARGEAAAPVVPVVVTQQQDPQAVSAMEAAGEAADRLRRAIDAGIRAYVVMDGPDGLADSYERYNRIRNNPRA